jgi:hypothetical protein
MKNLVKLSYLILFSIAISCTQDSTLDPIPSNLENLKGVSAKNSKKEKAKIVGLPGIKGKSTLIRNENEIWVNFNAKGLTPGAYTIWWVIWNEPLECEIPGECDEPDFGVADDVQVEVMYADGLVVGKNGKGDFEAHLMVGDDTGSVNGLFGIGSYGGLQAGKTYSSEVHIVLRTHGPVQPDLLDEQISSYGGGCETGDCADIAFSIHPPSM